jgi:hypothetical protein
MNRLHPVFDSLPKIALAVLALGVGASEGSSAVHGGPHGAGAGHVPAAHGGYGHGYGYGRGYYGGYGFYGYPYGFYGFGLGFGLGYGFGYGYGYPYYPLLRWRVLRSRLSVWHGFSRPCSRARLWRVAAKRESPVRTARFAQRITPRRRRYTAAAAADSRLGCHADRSRSRERHRLDQRGENNADRAAPRVHFGGADAGTELHLFRSRTVDGVQRPGCGHRPASQCPGRGAPGRRFRDCGAGGSSRTCCPSRAGRREGVISSRVELYL